MTKDGKIPMGKLCVCATYKEELLHLGKIINDYFGEYLEISSCYPDELEDLKEEPDCFLTTVITRDIVPQVYPNARNIYMERSMTGQNMELLIGVPRGSRVLIVNSPMRAAIDSVEKLRKLGIRDLQLTAYWPGCDVDTTKYKYVAYFGTENYCPNGEFTRINLGNRTIALEVIIDVINFFNLPSTTAEIYYKRNIDSLINRAEIISNMLKSTEQSLANFVLACDINTNILFSINQKGTINIFNRASENFFGISRERAIGENYKNLTEDFAELEKIIEKGEEVEEYLLEHNEQKLVASITKFVSDEQTNMLINLVSVPELQKSESQIRRRLRRNEFTAKYTFNSIKGRTPKLIAAKEFANICAQSDATILITGESGTGKELFAQSIHNASSRADEPFVGINFAALPETLAESELFGYEEGAFTGAVKGGKQGLFELAHCGTIFLDEIGDASLSMQTKLLRVLEEKEIVRVGGTKIIPVDVRVVCATNKDLKKMVSEGTFREDLYYRIKVLTFQIPPLRQRKEDIPVLIKSMLKEKDIEDFITPEIYDIFDKATWPGNIRELKAVAEYIKVLGALKPKGKYPDKTLNDMLYEYLMTNMEFETEPVKAEEKPEEIPGIPDKVDQETYAILKAIYDLRAKKINPGRGTLSKEESLISLGLTEAKIKSRLKNLEQEEYIQIGKTKQGATLTDKGIQAIGK